MIEEDWSAVGEEAKKHEGEEREEKKETFKSEYNSSQLMKSNSRVDSVCK